MRLIFPLQLNVWFLQLKVHFVDTCDKSWPLSDTFLPKEKAVNTVDISCLFSQVVLSLNICLLYGKIRY